jgi:sporulation protein YlmC with PRC-barrel domain
MSREIHLEQLLGTQVTDASGRPVGRIEEFRIEQRGDEWVVTEYLLGVTGILARLGVRSVGRLVGISLQEHAPQRVPWDRLDLSDPRHPTLREPPHAGPAHPRVEGAVATPAHAGE